MKKTMKGLVRHRGGSADPGRGTEMPQQLCPVSWQAQAHTYKNICIKRGVSGKSRMQNALWCRDLVPRESLIKKQKTETETKHNNNKKNPEAERRQSTEGWEGTWQHPMLLSSEEITPFLLRPSFFSAHLGLDHGFTTAVLRSLAHGPTGPK